MKKWTPLNYFIKLRKYKRINKNNALPSLSKFTLVLPAEIFRYIDIENSTQNDFAKLTIGGCPSRPTSPSVFKKI